MPLHPCFEMTPDRVLQRPPLRNMGGGGHVPLRSSDAHPRGAYCDVVCEGNHIKHYGCNDTYKCLWHTKKSLSATVYGGCESIATVGRAF
jgi:hypothetical protein